jgi:ubiquinone/menaquinone biosynthesis C-methylase UbiE
MKKNRLMLPDRSLLIQTGEVDYYDWNYRFPIKYILKYRYKRIIQLLGKEKYNTLLEAGMGSGIFLPELSKHCEQLYGCDIHSNLDIIRNLCEKSGIKDFHLSTQSIDNTTFPGNFFDAVVAVSVLEFVPDIEKSVNEIKRILKTDGIFITICPMESTILDFFLSFYSRKHPKEEFGDSRKKVSKILEHHFTVVKKGYMTRTKLFPIYTYFKLKKPMAG